MPGKAPDVAARIRDEAKVAYSRVKRKQKSQMKLPIRALSNVSYRSRQGFLQLRGRSKIRTLTVGSGNATHLNEYFRVPQARFPQKLKQIGAFLP